MTQAIQIQEHAFRITEIVDEAPNVKTFRVHLPDSFPKNFFPGQFFMVRLQEGDTLKRAYSIASSPTDHGFMDITMDLVGEFTKKLWHLKKNDVIYFSGPYGRFYFNDTMKKDLVLIAGGLGITPMRSILRYCKDKQLSNKVALIYSVKTPEEIIYRKELEEYPKKLKDFAFVPTITRPEASSPWNGRVGRIDRQLLVEHIGSIKDDLFFLCGSNGFVNQIRDMLYELGAQKEQIKTDIWGE